MGNVNKRNSFRCKNTWNSHERPSKCSWRMGIMENYSKFLHQSEPLLFGFFMNFLKNTHVLSAHNPSSAATALDPDAWIKRPELLLLLLSALPSLLQLPNLWPKLPAISLWYPETKFLNLLLFLFRRKILGKGAHWDTEEKAASWVTSIPRGHRLVPGSSNSDPALC